MICGPSVGEEKSTTFETVFNAVTDFHAITTSVYTRTQEKNQYQDSLYVLLILTMIISYNKLVVGEKLSLKDMWKFIVPTRKINTSILNEYYIFLSYIYILTIIRLFIYFLFQHPFFVFEYE